MQHKDTPFSVSSQEGHENTEGKIMGVDVTQKYCYLLCNDCKNTFLTSTVKSKLVCKLIIKADHKLSNYSVFNDVIKTFPLLSGRACKILRDISDDEMKPLLLHTNLKSRCVEQSKKVKIQFM